MKYHLLSSCCFFVLFCTICTVLSDVEAHFWKGSDCRVSRLITTSDWTRLKLFMTTIFWRAKISHHSFSSCRAQTHPLCRCHLVMKLTFVCFFFFFSGTLWQVYIIVSDLVTEPCCQRDTCYSSFSDRLLLGQHEVTVLLLCGNRKTSGWKEGW